MVIDDDTYRTVGGLRFCIDLSHHPWTRPRVIASADAMGAAASNTIGQIEAADRAGLDSAWVSEDPDGWDAFSVLSAASRSTSRVRLGTGVTNPYLRHPNQIAMSVSTLDRLTGGRAFLGLGRGQPEWYRNALGVNAAGSPLRRLESTIRLLHQWWQPPYRASSREAISVNDWARAIWPAQDRPPIYLAAIGPNARDLAARLADGLLIADFASMPYLEWLLPEMRARVAGYGRDPDRFHIYVRTAIRVTEDPEAYLHYRKTLMAVLAALPGMSQQIVHPDFDVGEIVRRIGEVMRTREVLRSGGNFIDIRRVADFVAARDQIPDELIDDLSYVGEPAKVRAKLDRLAELGATHVFLATPAEPDAGDLHQQMSWLKAGSWN